MKLIDAKINGFGKLHKQVISFGDGIHIIQGPNEAGKSTFHTFLKAMLFGMERGRGRASKNDLFTRYAPWDGGAFGGTIRFSSQGNIYVAERDFSSPSKKGRFFVGNHLREITDPDQWQEALCGLNETLYSNTLSISHLGTKTDDSLCSSLGQYVDNLGSAGDGSIQIKDAVQQLKKERREWERKLTPVNSEEYASLQEKIEAYEKELSSMEEELPAQNMDEEKEKLYQELKEHTNQSRKLTLLLQKSRTLAQDDSPLSQEEADSAAQSARDAYEVYEKYRFLSPKKASLHRLLSYLFLAGVLFCFLGAVKNFLSHNYLLFLPFLLLYLGFYLLSRQFQCKADRADYCQRAYEYLISQLELYLDTDQLTKAAFKQLLESYSGYQNLAYRISQCQEALLAENQKIEEIQEALKHAQDQALAASKTSWNIEKMQEEILRLSQRLDSLNGYLEDNKQIQEEIDSIDLALSVMESVSQKLKDTFSPELNAVASRLLGSMTAGAYSGMTLESDASLCVLTRFRKIPANQLSQGTIDQVYLSFRLASILYMWPRTPLPLLFDDAFNHYDDVRLESTLLWLNENYPGQILIFTCQDREARILKENGVPFQKITL